VGTTAVGASGAGLNALGNSSDVEFAGFYNV
jgi:hypothetical protein